MQSHSSLTGLQASKVKVEREVRFTAGAIKLPGACMFKVWLSLGKSNNMGKKDLGHDYGHIVQRGLSNCLQDTRQRNTTLHFVMEHSQ